MYTSNHPARKVLLFGIGAQKAGTSWLTYNLRQHPQVYSLPVKEVHFLDRIGLERRVVWRLRASTPREQRHRRVMQKCLRRLCRFKNVSLNLRLLRLLLLPFTISHIPIYVRIMRGFPKSVSFDMTPAYAKLTREVISAVHRAAPDAKVVFIMRDLIDRHWSGALMLRFHNTGIVPRPLTWDETIETVQLNNKRNDYLYTIRNWSSAYPQSQILYCFFDELRDEPLKFYNRILHFLGIEEVSVVPIETKVNEGPKIGIPEDVKLQLAKCYYEQTKELATFFQTYDSINYPAQWLKRIENILATEALQTP